MAYTGHLRKEQDAAFLSRQRLTVRCALCKWKREGLAPDVLTAQREHFQNKHGLVRTSRRRTRALGAFTQNNLTDADKVEVEAERQKRALETGVEL